MTDKTDSAAKPWTVEEFLRDRYQIGEYSEDDKRDLATVEALARAESELAEIDQAEDGRPVLAFHCTNCDALRKRAEAAERELERLGFRRCDVAACNCGGWHQHRATVIESSLSAQVEALKKDRDHWREEHEHRRGECLAALMVEKAAQDRAEAAEMALTLKERDHWAAARQRDEALAELAERYTEAEVLEALHQASVRGPNADAILSRIRQGRKP
jgi:hypothetical protein